jgi:hypothetical protein
MSYVQHTTQLQPSNPFQQRNIDKAGGLDNYILKTPPHKLDSDMGEKIRMELLNKIRQQQWQQQAAAGRSRAGTAEGLSQRDR